jgi:hypothetical protein
LAGFRSSTGLENTTSAKPFVLQSVSFPVEVSGNGRVGISEIEVYDNIVWKRYFSNLHATVNRRALIDLYVKSLTLDTTPRRNAEIKTKWNLIFSCNEPHSIESYDATRIVKEDIKLMNRTEESTRFYPGWNAIIK